MTHPSQVDETQRQSVADTAWHSAVNTTKRLHGTLQAAECMLTEINNSCRKTVNVRMPFIS